MRSVFVTVFALSAWAFTTLPAAAARADIVAPGSGLVLGTGWYSLEGAGATSFRWAKNDAEVLVFRPSSSVKKIWIDAEPGPGLGSGRMSLQVVENGRVVASADYTGRQRLRYDVPVTSGAATIAIRLRVPGAANRAVPKDRRTLNFRVFAIADASSDVSLGAGHPDVGGPGITIGDNWYSLEQYKGETFRWVANDARFTVVSDKATTKRLKVILAPGPGLTHPENFTIALYSDRGSIVQKASVKGGRRTVYLTLPLVAGANRFSLHVDGGGRRGVNGDTRTLDFRVFGLWVVD